MNFYIRININDIYYFCSIFFLRSKTSYKIECMERIWIYWTTIIIYMNKSHDLIVIQ